MSEHTDKIVKSTLLVVVTKWTQRLFGIVSLIVLARLLDPEDFGIVAMSYIVLSFFEAISVTGAEQYLLSRSALKPGETDVAWSLNLLMKIGVSVLLLLVAPLAATVFHEPRVEAVLSVTCIVPVLNALGNPGFILNQREYRYGAISIVKITTKMVSFLVSITLAIRYQSYWALVAGQLVQASTFTTMSYLLSSYRPRARVSGMTRQWNFSKWMLARSVVGFTRAKADQLMMGMFYDTSAMGSFNVSKELVLMPFHQISEPLHPLLLTMFTSANTKKAGLRRAYSLQFILLFAVMLPLTCGIFVLREELVALLLGAKWVGAETLIGALSLLLLAFSMTESSSAIFLVMDRLRFLFSLEVITMLVVVVGQLIASRLPIEEFALARSLLGMVVFAVYFAALRKAIELDMTDFLSGLIGPVLACACMFGVLTWLDSTTSGLAFLVSGVCLGALTYGAALLCICTLLRRFHENTAFICETLEIYGRRALRGILVRPVSRWR